MTDDRCKLLCLDLDLAETLRSTRIDGGVAEERAARAAALSDATRLVIADALARAGELCVCDLSWVVERSENLVSHHVRRLRSADLVSSRRDGKMVLYSLTPAGRVLLDAVLETRANDDAEAGV
jgi:DNA-binding transcriptional ArsR family regulator